MYTIVTFPFLFAVMFGDLGHGIIVTLFAGWMCLFEKKLANKKFGEVSIPKRTKDVTRNNVDVGSDITFPFQIWDIFYGGRYIILMMGVFSMYTGILYNDIFSLSMNIFGSAWTPARYTKWDLEHNSTIGLDPATSDFAGSPYIVGLDPVWQVGRVALNPPLHTKCIPSVVHSAENVMFTDS